jgi:alkaline phosphatase D
MRRFFLFPALVAALVATAAPAYAHEVVYTSGVASGDVTPNRAVLWTRIDRAANAVGVTVSKQSNFSTRAFHGQAAATAANDFTVKIDASGLSPNTRYFYRFDHHGYLSPVGQFKTAPDSSLPANLRFTYSGDSDGAKGPNRPASYGNFEPLDAARAENAAFFAYLGDTIYSDSEIGGVPPATTLDQYRAKYKENRTYPALRNLLASTSTYAQWDDHEVYNDFDGQTVDPARYAAGRKAFLEYMPVREGDFLSDPSCAGDPMFSQYKWGKDVDIIIPDERSCRSAEDPVKAACTDPSYGLDPAPTAPADIREMFGYPPSPPPGCLAAINDPSRTMLGPVQKAALKGALLNSTAKFKFIINEVPIQQFYALPYDRWEGYAPERTELLNFIRNRNIKNVVFLTTDTHATLLNEVFKDQDSAPTPISYEAVTGPIATKTFANEVRDFGGNGALIGVNFLLNHVGEDCRDLDTNSYALVRFDDAAGTTQVTSKDATGAPVHDRGDPSRPACTKTLGP